MIDRSWDADRLRRRRRRFAAWGIEAEVGVAGQFGGASASAFGQVAFGQRLQTPGDPFDEPGAVTGRRGFAEEFGEAVQAHIGVTGQNPRKGVHGSRDDVLKELADVIVTAGIAMIAVAEGNPAEAERHLNQRLETVTSRVGV